MTVLQRATALQPAAGPVAAGAPCVLAVDLDGTLLRSDMLHETFWNACARDWRTPVLAAQALPGGRAALKRALAAASDVDVSTLPYNDAVIDRVAAWRAQGGRTALVTASDAGIARRIADHLGLFDEVHGSDGSRNLKAAEKAAFLSERFGSGFVYVGDAAADLPVWRAAAQAITVDAPAGLRRQVDALGGPVEHLASRRPGFAAHTRAMRPHQWLKNGLVFLPMLAAHDLSGATLLLSLVAFAAFSLVASSVYLLNDLLDLGADRAHPRKRSRPFASGALPIAHGVWMIGGLLGLGAALSALLGWQFLLVMAGYYGITTAYSFSLKRRVVVDICTLAGLYTLRIIAGGAATGIDISLWLLAFSMFFFLSLAAIKRQAELVDSARRGMLAAGGRGYTVEDVQVVSQMAVAAGYVSVLVMALYINSPAVLMLYSAPAALWGICLVLLFWLSRVAMVAHRGEMHDDPVVYAIKDRTSRICGLLVVTLAAAGTVL